MCSQCFNRFLMKRLRTNWPLPPLLILAALACGCASRFEYIKPPSQVATPNFKMIEKPREEVWNAAIPALGKQFFVINNLDKDSGLINLSYAGDPEQYIECGRI